MNDIFLKFTPHHWSLIIVLAVTVAAHFLAGIALRRLGRIAASTSNIWDDALFEAARRPLPVFVWLSGLFVALNIHYSSAALPVILVHGRTITLTICISWFLIALIKNLAKMVVALRIEGGQQVDIATVDGIGKAARVTVLVVAGLVIIQSMGFSISGVLAFGGIGGIAIGFAAKDLLANLLGGLILHLDRPFKLGESVRSPDKDIEGLVEHIGWRQTALRARNMDMIYVPNSLFNSIVLVNVSRRSHRRIDETIGLRYEDLPRIEAVCAEVRAMLMNHPDIDTNREVVVAFSRFGESGLEILISVFTDCTSDFNVTKQSVLLAIACIVARLGADFAFPSRTLYMAGHTPSDRTLSS